MRPEAVVGWGSFGSCSAWEEMTYQGKLGVVGNYDCRENAYFV